MLYNKKHYNTVGVCIRELFDYADKKEVWRVAKSANKGGNPLAALKHPNYRLFWSGQAVSVIGTWIQRACQAWLVLQITDSPFLLGLVGAMQFLPVLFLSLVAGVIADRVSKRRLVFWTQLLLGVQAFILSYLVFTDQVQYWHILVLALFQGICTAFDQPTRQSLIVEMVGKDDLMNAIALNSALFNGARIVGPAIGGITMDLFGPALAFLLNGVSYLFVVGALALMKLPNKVSAANNRRFWPEIKEGLLFAKQTPIIRDTLVLVGLTGVTARNMTILIPVLAKDALGQSATGYGILMSCMGAGALLGAVTLAWIAHLGPNRRLLYTGAFALVAMELLLALPQAFGSAAILVFLLGWANITYSATANSSLQVNTPNHLRGRVMSLYSLLNGGVSPIGNLYAGIASDLFGAGGGFLACGGLGLIFTMAVFTLEKRRGFAKDRLETA
jgi:MFS family permease